MPTSLTSSLISRDKYDDDVFVQGKETASEDSINDVSSLLSDEEIETLVSEECCSCSSFDPVCCVSTLTDGKLAVTEETIWWPLLLSLSNCNDPEYVAKLTSVDSIVAFETASSLTSDVRSSLEE